MGNNFVRLPKRKLATVDDHGKEQNEAPPKPSVVSSGYMKTRPAVFQPRPAQIIRPVGKTKTWDVRGEPGGRTHPKKGNVPKPHVIPERFQKAQ